MHLLWNRGERRLRAFWRILIQAMLTVALGSIPIIAIAEPLTALRRRGLAFAGLSDVVYDRAINMIVGPLIAIAVLASVAIAARWLDRRPLAHFGIRIDRAWWTCLAGGFALGGALMAFIFVIELAAGWIRITGFFARNAAGVPLALAFAFTIVKVLCVGVYEELQSRGYLLHNLIDGTNVPIAVALSSLVFALLHLTNDNASIASAAGLFVNGVLFAVAVLVTRRVSTAIGLHIAWNFFQGAVFGFPVSGDKEGASLIAIEQLGPDAMTGGAFGPEAGVIGVMASVIGMIIVARTARGNDEGPPAGRHGRQRLLAQPERTAVT